MDLPLDHFGDLTTEEGLEKLNSYLADKNFIDGDDRDSCDKVFFWQLNRDRNKPIDDKYPHIQRWENQMLWGVRPLNENIQAVEMDVWPSADDSFFKRLADFEDEYHFHVRSDDDENDPEVVYIRRERAEHQERRKARKAYNEMKSEKAVPNAKSSVVLDVSPARLETDILAVESGVRAVQMDGLVWGASERVPDRIDVQKLRVTCVVENAKVDVDELITEIKKACVESVCCVEMFAFAKI